MFEAYIKIQSLKKEQLKTYLIDCLGYSEQDISEIDRKNSDRPPTRKDLLIFIEDIPGATEACLSFAN